MVKKTELDEGFTDVAGKTDGGETVPASEINTPVAPAGGDPKGKNRKADVNKSVPTENPPSVSTPEGTGGEKKAPARLADKKSMKESIDEMFAGSELSEEFKENVTVIFEAAVHAKINEEVERLEEEFNSKLDEQVTKSLSSLEEKVDEYLTYVAKEWLEENKVAIDSSIRNDIAESFLMGLKDLFVEHNVKLDDEEVEVLENVVEELEETKSALDEALKDNMELKKQLDESKVSDILESYTTGLTAIQAEKLKALSEGIEYSNSAEFEKKLKIIKENYFGVKTALKESADLVDPIDDDVTAPKVLSHDPAINAYVEAISRNIRK